jgi:hypothetical protein
MMPLGVIDLWVTFDEAANYRQEILSFKVMDFKDTFHAMLGIPCFIKFMAVPHCAYLKMKMLGPNGVITISRDLQNAYQCELLAIKNAIQNLDPAQRELDYVLMQGQDLGAPTQAPSCLNYQSSPPKEKRLPPAQFTPSGPTMAPSFTPGDDSRKVCLEKTDSSKTCPES